MQTSLKKVSGFCMRTRHCLQVALVNPFPRRPVDNCRISLIDNLSIIVCQQCSLDEGVVTVIKSRTDSVYKGVVGLSITTQ